MSSLLNKLFILLFAGLAIARPDCGIPPGVHLIPTVPRTRNTTPTNVSSVVTINTDCGRCTGWVVKKNVFVTAAHCVEEPGERVHIYATFLDKTKVPLTLVVKGAGVVDSNSDVAILSGDSKGVEPIELELTNIPKDAQFPCFTLGFGPQNTQKLAYCAGRVDDPYNKGIFIYAGSVDHGDSGGPVIVETGKAVGLITMLDMNDQTIFFSIPSQTIKKFLDKSGL